MASEQMKAFLTSSYAGLFLWTCVCRKTLHLIGHRIQAIRQLRLCSHNSNYHQWLNCPATGGESLSLKLLDYTFVRLGEKFQTSIKHSIPPCTREVRFCSQLKYTEP